MIHSRDDEVVEFEPTEKTVKELQRLGRKIEFEPLEGVGHFNMNMYVDPLSRAASAGAGSAPSQLGASSLREPSSLKPLGGLSFLRHLQKRVRRVRPVRLAADERDLTLARDPGHRDRDEAAARDLGDGAPARQQRHAELRAPRRA